jgi:hypothetical protein
MKRLSEYTDAEFGHAIDAEMDRRLSDHLDQPEENADLEDKFDWMMNETDRQVVADFTEENEDDEQ